MQMHRTVSLVSGAGLGAGLTYFLDPERGRRRRASVHDKGHRLSRETGKAAARLGAPGGAGETGKTARLGAPGGAGEIGECTRMVPKDMWSRDDSRGAASQSWVQPTPPGSDKTLVERVRAKMGQTQSTWSPTARTAAALMGTAAMLYGARRRTAGAATVAASGLGLLVRSMTNQEFGKMFNFRIGSFGQM